MFAWQNLLGDEYDLAFTIAKMLYSDLLHTVRTRLDPDTWQRLPARALPKGSQRA